MKTVAIIGGGFAGITVANKLAKKAKKFDFKVLLIEPRTEHLYEPGLLYLGFNDKPISSQTKPIKKILSKKVRHVNEFATKIDTETNEILLETKERVSYDFLVIATGVHYDETKINVMEEEKINHFFSGPATLKLRDKLKKFEGGTIVISPTTVPYKCPPAPAEWILLLDKYLRNRKIRSKTTIKYLYPLSRPYPIANAGDKIAEMFEKRGIEFEGFCNFDQLDKENQKFISFEGEEIEYDELILIPHHEGQKVIKDSALGDREGYVPTDRYTLKVDNHDNIYAVGDCTNLPLAKAGTVAHFSASILVKNLLLQIAGKEPTVKYDGLTLCFIVTSFKKSMLLHFSYDFPPRKYGLHSTVLYGIMKRIFKPLYFKMLIKGYI